MDNSFGAWIKRRRKSLYLTQQQLAKKVGYSVSAIIKFEANERRPSRQIAELLADHLEIPPDRRAQFLNMARQESTASTEGDAKQISSVQRDDPETSVQIEWYRPSR
jgi:transcriptional regulator with XRE-family HTH domain